MSMEQRLIDYVRQETNGRVNLTPGMVKGMIAIMNDVGQKGSALAQLHRFNALRGGWEFLYSRLTTDEEVNLQTREALKKNPVEREYRWDCYNSLGQLEGYIFTVNTSLF
jgi:hypothetical protein